MNVPIFLFFKIPLDFRALVDLGCLCSVDKKIARTLKAGETDTFELGWLQFKTLASYHYLPKGSYKTVYLYQHRGGGSKSLYGLFIPATRKAHVFVVDTVRSNQMPNLNNMYNAERAAYLEKVAPGSDGATPEGDYTFEIRVETDLRQVYRQIQRLLAAYKEEKRGPSFVVTQSALDFPSLLSAMPALADFPMVPIHVSDSETLYNVLDWQRVGARHLIRHFLKSDAYLQATIEQCRYFHVPVGNLPKDTTAFGADLFFARHLRKQNFVLWCSPTEKPDLGGNFLTSMFPSFLFQQLNFRQGG